VLLRSFVSPSWGYLPLYIGKRKKGPKVNELYFGAAGCGACRVNPTVQSRSTHDFHSAEGIFRDALRPGLAALRVAD
jgi:hypothetical protein